MDVYDRDGTYVGQVYHNGDVQDRSGNYVGTVYHNGDVHNRNGYLGTVYADGKIGDTSYGGHIYAEGSVNDRNDRHVGRVSGINISSTEDRYYAGGAALLLLLQPTEAKKPLDSYVAPPPQSYPYSVPSEPPPSTFMSPDQPHQRQGSGVGLIIGIIALVVLLIVGGIIAIQATRNTTQSNVNTPTDTTSSSTSPTSTASGVSPSGSPVDPTAAAIITNPQTASAVDSNYFPTNVTSNFSIGQTVYVTFHLNTNGQGGYSQAKLYSDTTYVGDKILALQASYDHGYFSVQLNNAATGTVELYWCTQSDCSDGKLATLVTFQVA